MVQWPEFRDNGFLKDVLDTDEEVKYWSHIFDRTYEDGINTWDYQLMFASWINGVVNILPCSNLVKNIGFGTDGTHTTSSDHQLSNMETIPISFPLKHPSFFIRDAMSDIYSAWTTYGVPVSVGMMKSIGMDDEIPTYVQGKIVPPQRPADVDTILIERDLSSMKATMIRHLNM